ncbi:MAG TPA: tripartite tricarboxylate transporter TctB family protein [Xanthobacteraceae bacterium]
MPPVRSFDHIIRVGRNLTRKRDFYAGGLMILFGLIAAVNGPGYRIGTVMHMGPGFMPTALGVLLICLGVVIAGSAITVPPGEDEDILPAQPEWLGWACILAGPLMFIIFGTFGFIPGTFACVFVSALGDRTATWKSAAVLAAVVTVFGVGVFSYFLQIPMPLFRAAW